LNVLKQKLGISLKLYQFITENANDLIAIISKSTKYEYINKKACKKILGYEYNEMIGKRAVDFIHHDDFHLVFKAIEDGKNFGEAEVVLRFKHKNGNWLWLEVRGKKLVDEEGFPKGLIIARDITKQKLAQQKLKDSEKRYRLITENAKDLIALFDHELRYEFINESVHEKILGYLKEDMIGERLATFIHPDDLKHVAKIIWKKLKHGEGKAELRFRKKDGTYIWLEAGGKAFTDKNGLLKGITVSRDITDRKIAEQKLKESEKKFRDLFESSPYSILLFNFRGNIIDCNSATEKLFGYNKDELLNKNFLELTIFPSVLIPLLERRHQLLSNGIIPKPLEFQMYKKNGNRIWVNITNSLIETDGSRAIQVILHDISEKKTTEIQLKSSEKRYREAYQRVEFYKDLFAHDVINIFQVISSSTELFRILNKNIRFPKESEDILNLIKEQTKRGNRLVSNVRALSKLEEAEINLKSVEIYRILENSIKYVKDSFYYKDIHLHFNFIHNEIYVHANELLADIFENILINAVKYNANEIIEISIKISRIVEDKRIYIKIEFIDNGIGIKDSIKELIFKRGSKDRKGGKGMGLGLSLVCKIVKEYGGDVWVEDRIEGDYTQGSNFVLLLPETVKESNS
jgi:PAS domain S-box-containing protein